jgi:DNA-binding response OmpR family regulator
MAVDDNRVILNIVRFNLQRAGFSVTVARDGCEAWDLLQTEDVDLLIIDYQMPGMNGEELCRRLRDDASFGNLPVIMLSAKGLELDLARLKEELGLREVVFKPFSPSSLVATVEACLEDQPNVA